MSINFDETIDRRGTSCLKWDFAVERGYPADVLPFWVADMDFRVPATVIDKLNRRIEHGIFGYTDPKDDYKDTIIRWQTEQHGYTPQRKSLVVTPGVVFAIATAIRAYTAVGEGIIIQQPVYYPFSEMIRANGRKLINSPLVLKDGRYQIDFADFEQKIIDHKVKLFILCSPHNPVGRVWSREELTRLANICLKHDVVILADEIHNDFVRNGHQHATLPSLSTAIAENTVLCTSPSKTFNLAGLQISNVFIENDMLRRRFVDEMAAAGYSQPNVLGLVAAEAAYADGLSWLNELRAYVESNYQKAKEFLARELPRITVIEPEGTYLLWLDFRSYGLSDKELDEIIIQRARLWLDSGDIFGSDGSGFQRINLACPWATLDKGLAKLAAAFKEI